MGLAEIRKRHDAGPNPVGGKVHTLARRRSSTMAR